MGNSGSQGNRKRRSTRGDDRWASGKWLLFWVAAFLGLGALVYFAKPAISIDRPLLGRPTRPAIALLIHRSVDSWAPAYVANAGTISEEPTDYSRSKIRLVIAGNMRLGQVKARVAETLRLAGVAATLDGDTISFEDSKREGNARFIAIPCKGLQVAGESTSGYQLTVMIVDRTKS